MPVNLRTGLIKAGLYQQHEQLAKAEARMAVGELGQRIDELAIIRVLGLVAVYRTAQPELMECGQLDVVLTNVGGEPPCVLSGL